MAKKNLTQTCQAHKTYQAKYAPRVMCYDCWEIFFRENSRFRRLVEEVLA
jgi:hypothetical protein